MRSANAFRLLVAAVAILALTAVLPARATAQVAIGISVGFPPPELPVYAQPICPGEGYIWTPGYWDWDRDDEDYYWVPGTWVLAPEVGYLWTPGYWGWGGTAFVFYEGYWGPVVGFYGGIAYGYGYFGHGYEGGRWDGGRFYYNRAVNNINVSVIRNVYNTRVVNNFNSPRVSYNGGNGGVNARATPQEQSAAREHHIKPVPAQVQHIQAARSNRELRASQNHGKPPIAATQKPGTFSGAAAVPAKKAGKYNPPPNRGANNRAANNANRPANAGRTENNANRPANASRTESNTNRAGNNANRPNYVHPNDLPKANRADRPPSSGNPKTDQKYQQQQEKMYQKQDQERQKLQQKQDQEHQRMAQQRADDTRKQQMEQRHQQQTQQMQQRHEQQQQRMEQRQQPPASHPSERKPPK